MGRADNLNLSTETIICSKIFHYRFRLSHNVLRSHAEALHAMLLRNASMRRCAA